MNSVETLAMLNSAL